MISTTRAERNIGIIIDWNISNFQQPDYLRRLRPPHVHTTVSLVTFIGGGPAASGGGASGDGSTTLQSVVVPEVQQVRQCASGVPVVVTVVEVPAVEVTAVEVPSV